MGKNSNHHIGKVAQRAKVKHVFRPRVLCRGNAEYERLMAEAKEEFDAAERRSKERNTPRRKR